jgi:hypothetical protein
MRCTIDIPRPLPWPVARRERAVYVAPMTNGLVIGGAF